MGPFTRPLTQNWGRGRIQLIGDAAHAMLPNAGQGACQAFEDAYILARWLEACGDPVEAFADFRRVRIPRVHGVQRLSLSNARFKHMRDSASQKESITAGTGSARQLRRLGLTIRSANGTRSLQFYRLRGVRPDRRKRSAPSAHSACLRNCHRPYCVSLDGGRASPASEFNWIIVSRALSSSKGPRRARHRVPPCLWPPLLPPRRS